MLGTGTCIPSPYRAPAGIVIRSGECNLLFDSGSGTLMRLTKAGISYQKLYALCYTHTHPDHVIDLVPILQAFHIASPNQRKSPLLITGPDGFRDFMTQLADIFGSWMLAQSIPMNIYELMHGQLTLPCGILKTAPMEHSRPAIGYRLEIAPNGPVIVYSGDTDYCDEMVELAKWCDVLILECSTPNENKKTGHLTPAHAARIAAKSRAARLVLTHFYPEMDDVDIIGQCQGIFDGEIIPACDGMKINVPFAGTSGSVESSN